MSMCDSGAPTPVDDAALAGLIPAFYVKARADALLGGLFGSAIADDAWPRHLDQMVAFWSSVMGGAGHYRGNPMAAHMKHVAALTPAMFARWLVLWEETAHEHLNEADAEAIVVKARRIAESLQYALYRPCPVRRDRAVA